MALVSPGATCWGMFRANLKKLILSTRYLPCVRFCTEEFNPFNDVLKKPRSLEDLERRFNVEVSDEQESVLKALKTANVTPLYDARKDGVRVSALTLPSAVLDSTSRAGPLASTLFIRDFYHRYFDLLRKEDKSVVMGNPGVSKSWFQWYILYRLVNEKEIPNLGPNHLNSREPPKVIVRQVGDSKLFFYFPLHDKVYRTSSNFYLDDLNPNSALYLFEPDTSYVEPRTCRLQTITTCSPDRRRYKEFCKHGGISRYMPCWNLDELQTVGAYVAAHCDESLKDFYAPEAIEERYDRFGGIFRYVIPGKKSLVEQAKKEQDDVIGNTKPEDSFEPSAGIEKRDDRKNNISHFILKYDVQYGGEYEGKENEFTNFDMTYTSNYVRLCMADKKISDEAYMKMLWNLRLIFIGGRRNDPHLFEHVVCEDVEKQKLKWEVFEAGEWVKHDWGFEKWEFVSKGKESTMNMKPGILYYPADENFPLLDFVFVKMEQGKKRVFGIQVTFAKTHAKDLSVHHQAYKRLGMKLNQDELRVYVIPNPLHAKLYSKRKSEQFVRRGSMGGVQYSTVKMVFSNPIRFRRI